ncbi:acyltransferase family protein [Oerskovia sp. NPDC060338]|uniref:acyltransferase family protein n=1 Tax=Oerskovia sp. NPDC060338 TaxID=3347100 RepID=UPI003652AED9
MRIIAALLVVFFHIRGNIASEFPSVYSVVGPIIDHGELGVDLFFVLSGFVLALNYTSRMGQRFERGAAGRFLWARIARIWPVFFVTLAVAGVWHGIFVAGGGGDPVAPREYSVPSFLQQTFLVALWDEPDFDRLMWNGPAWSVSAEALAYLVFPVSVLLFYRLGRIVGARANALLAVAAMLPVTMFVGASGGLYFEWSWLLRIVCGFTAGALLYQSYHRWRPTASQRAWASHGAVAIIVLVIAICYVAGATGYGHLVPMVAPLFVVLIGLLAVGDRHVVKLLGTRLFLVGGAASYSVYMVHMLVIEPFWWAQGKIPALFAPGSVGSKIGFIAIPFVVCVVGYVLWRYVEEPARHVMRRMSLRFAEQSPGARAMVSLPTENSAARVLDAEKT